MFDQNRIKEEFRGLVGFRQNDNPDFPQLSSTLLYDGTNVLVSHSLINIENIDMCVRNYSKFNYATYNPATEYDEDTAQTMVRVKYNNKAYRSKVSSNTGNQPDTHPDEWEELNLLSLYLEDIQDNSSEEVVNEVALRKQLFKQTKNLISSRRFFEGVGNINDLVVNEGDLVGVQIKLLNSNGLTAIIEQVGIQLSAVQVSPQLTFYLFHSSQVDPIATISVNHTKQASFQWHNAGFELRYLSDDYDAGGVFFLMYDQDQLTGQAIKKNHNFHIAPCAYCNRSDVDTFHLYSKYINMHSVRVKAAYRNQDDPLKLWDITKTEYTPNTNHGLNFQLTVKCDLTEFIVQQKDVFRYALRDMVTKKLLEAMANTTRQNGTANQVPVMARNELMSAVSGGMGFPAQLEKQLNAVNFEISSLDSVCMPCDNKSGLRSGTAGLSRGR